MGFRREVDQPVVVRDDGAEWAHLAQWEENGEVKCIGWFDHEADRYEPDVPDAADRGRVFVAPSGCREYQRALSRRLRPVVKRYGSVEDIPARQYADATIYAVAHAILKDWDIDGEDAYTPALGVELLTMNAAFAGAVATLSDALEAERAAQLKDDKVALGNS